MPPQVLELLERRLSRLHDEHGNRLPFQDNEALETVDIHRRVTISDAYEKLLTGNALALSLVRGEGVRKLGSQEVGVRSCNQAIASLQDLTPLILSQLLLTPTSSTSSVGRALYCFMVGKRVVVLHAFIKKTQQTPDRELKLARKRHKELQDG